MFSTLPAETTPARIGVFLPLDAAYGREVLRGIAHYYRALSRVEVLKFNQTSGYDLAKLRALALDGIIAKVVGGQEEELFLELGIPTINFSGQYQTRDLPTVTTDDARVGEMAFLHFAQRGFRHFAFTGAPQHAAARMRFEAFRAAAARRYGSAAIATLFVPEGDQDAPFPGHVREELARWVAELPKPVGIFTFTDRLALEIDEICRRRVIDVPRAVALLGVGNDLTRIEFAHVPLSSIELPTEQNGYRAAALLEQWRLHGERPPPLTLIPPRRLLTRASSDALAVADERVALALDFIHENLGNPIRVPDVARVAGVSRRSLELRFRDHLRQSIYEVVLSLKFARAQELLAQHEVFIGDIAERVGFRETKEFSRAFRQRFGLSPTAYRKAQQGRP
jgi:LacI family transcriptional regulator